jgi:hypothetical protein
MNNRVPVKNVALCKRRHFNKTFHPRPTSHHAGRQKNGNVIARHVSTIMPVGCQLAGHEVGKEIRISPKNPGIFAAATV